MEWRKRNGEWKRNGKRTLPCGTPVVGRAGSARNPHTEMSPCKEGIRVSRDAVESRVDGAVLKPIECLLDVQQYEVGGGVGALLEWRHQVGCRVRRASLVVEAGLLFGV